MSSARLVAGIDVGGTRIKMGIVDLEAGKVLSSDTWDTEKSSEEAFFNGISTALERMLERLGIRREDLAGAGISIGSYVYADGSIDGMTSFVPFLIQGFPMKTKMEEALGIPARVDNDARVIALAEARYGVGRGYRKTLTITLGTGVGIGLCVDGKPVGKDSFLHLAGHVKVRTGGEYPCLDREPCYCGIPGCFESTCSGASLEKYGKHELGSEVSNPELFRRAATGDEKAQKVVRWYLDMLSAALNQYIYLYCPDAIVIGGGVAKGLEPWADDLNRLIVAQVYTDQRTRILFTRLMEDGGILGGASLIP